MWEIDVDYVGNVKDVLSDVGDVDDGCDVDEVDVDFVRKDVGDVMSMK